jgi:hypothetical protein
MTQRLLNRYEEVTYDALNRLCKISGAKVFTKVRVADVIKLEGSGVSAEHFGYGLRSHFDFVVVDSDYQPLFSVEFDGPLHKTSGVQMQRDRLKNELCDHCHHGLLRINSNYLSKTYRGLDLLTYFVDAWFLEQAFDEAQRSGLIPYDEFFDMTFIYSDGSQSGRKWPYWLSLDIQHSLQKLHSAGAIGQRAASYHVGKDGDGAYRCLSWLVFDASHVVSVSTGMRAQRFPAVCKSELVSMLAMFDLYSRVEDVIRGDRTHLLDRRHFFDGRLPAFQEKYPMVFASSMGAHL